MIYRSEIDGLRAVAVVPVVLFHAGFKSFGGGFVGVDIFFVISGYLITSIIVSEMNRGTFSLTEFYVRRARRILPALFVVVLVSSLVGIILMPPVDLKEFSRAVIAVPLFASNILYWREAGYFDTAAELKPLLHTWTLAVEEQFYVIFPIFVLLAWRFGKRWIASFLIAAFLTSLTLAEWSSLRTPAAAFYLLPTRGWELAAGALLALYLERCPRLWSPSVLFKNIGSACGFLLIFFAVFAYSSTTPFPGLYALVPTIGASLIILFADDETIVGRILSARILVGLGLISYSAYLWHQPLFAFSRYYTRGELSVGRLAALIFIAFALAYATWAYVERPFRGKTSFRKSRVGLAAVAGTSIVLLVGVSGYVTGGFEVLFVKRLSPEQRQIYSIIRQGTGGDMYADMGDNQDCNFWAKEIDQAFSRRFRRCSETYGKAVIVLGDSHAMNVYNALHRAEFGNFVVGVTKGACRPHDNLTSCPYGDFSKFVSTNSAAIKLIMFHQSGSSLLHLAHGQNLESPILLDGKTYQTSRPIIDRTRAYLNDIATMATVIWLGPFVESRVDFRNLDYFSSEGFLLNGDSVQAFSMIDTSLREFLAATPDRFTYLSLSDILQIDRKFLKVGDCITYGDQDHFSVCGEKIVGNRLKARLTSR